MRPVCFAMVVLLAAPGVAQADSVTISAPAEGVIGGESTIGVTVEASGEAHNLYVIRKRVDDSPPCAATIFDDYSGGGTTEEVASGQNVQSGTYAYETEWIDQGIKPGEWRICAWLYGPSLAANNTAAPEARISLRVPKATIAIDSAKRGRVYIDAGGLTTSYRVAVSGTREEPADVRGFWKRKGACPTGRGADTGNDSPIIFPYRRDAEEGPFDVTGVTGGPDVALGRSYVLCTYVFSRYVEEPLTVDRAVVEPKTRPLSEGRPGIGTDTFPARRLKCHKGFWAAYPRRIRYAVRWYRDGRRLRARGNTLSVRPRDAGHRFACEVTARNAVGTSRKRSRPYRL